MCNGSESKHYQRCPNAGDKFSRLLAEHDFSPDITPVPCDYRQPLRPNPVLIGSILRWGQWTKFELFLVVSEN